MMYFHTQRDEVIRILEGTVVDGNPREDVIDLAQNAYSGAFFFCPAARHLANFAKIINELSRKNLQDNAPGVERIRTARGCNEPVSLEFLMRMNAAINIIANSGDINSQQVLELQQLIRTHFHLGNNRHGLPNNSVVMSVGRPNFREIERICKDLSKDLYGLSSAVFSGSRTVNNVHNILPLLEKGYPRNKTGDVFSPYLVTARFTNHLHAEISKLYANAGRPAPDRDSLRTIEVGDHHARALSVRNGNIVL